MTLLTVNDAAEGDGVDLTFASANGGGDTYTWSRNTVFIVTNDDSSPMVVTIVPANATQSDPSAGTTIKATIAHTVAVGATAFIDTRAQSFRNSSGLVAVTYSSVTSLTVAAVKQVHF